MVASGRPTRASPLRALACHVSRDYRPGQVTLGPSRRSTGALADQLGDRSGQRLPRRPRLAQPRLDVEAGQLLGIEVGERIKQEDEDEVIVSDRKTNLLGD